jgi:hypothetical protein
VYTGEHKVSDESPCAVIDVKRRGFCAVQAEPRQGEFAVFTDGSDGRNRDDPRLRDQVSGPNEGIGPYHGLDRGYENAAYQGMQSQQELAGRGD